MGFENFATNQPTAQEEENLSEFEVGVRRMEALIATHEGDAYEATKTVMTWMDEAKKRHDGKH
jgi:hypothetical protein